MKNLLAIALLGLVPAVGNSTEAKVICSVNKSMYEVVSDLNGFIRKAQAEGFDIISTPAISPGTGYNSSPTTICVTVSKSASEKTCK